MKKINWRALIWLVLATISALAMLADIIGGQDPYRNEAMMMLALLLAFASDIEGRYL